jgi:hypothetical protein
MASIDKETPTTIIIAEVEERKEISKVNIENLTQVKK